MLSPEAAADDGLRPQLVRWGTSAQACVSGMFELKDDSAFKAHLRDFLVQTKSFADKNNADLFAEEAAAQREVRSCCWHCLTGHMNHAYSGCRSATDGITPWSRKA